MKLRGSDVTNTPFKKRTILFRAKSELNVVKVYPDARVAYIIVAVKVLVPVPVVTTDKAVE